MKDFYLIGVRTFKNNEWEGTRYFKIGELKKAIEYAKDAGSRNLSYDFVCCDKSGTCICKL